MNDPARPIMRPRPKSPSNALAKSLAGPAPQNGLIVTHFLTVREVRVSREFYADVFGGEVVLAENPATVKIANTWIIMNPAGGPVTPYRPFSTSA
jgi:hypothetical protein